MLEETERVKYIRMWSEVPDYRLFSPGEALVADFIRDNAGTALDGDTLLDVGCGTGRAAQKLRDAGMEVCGLDIAKNCLDSGVLIPLIVTTAWDKRLPLVDWVYCTDVMEHIPPDRVEETLDNLRRITIKGAYFQIATKPDSYGARIGETLHLTLHEPSWWYEQLKARWKGSANCKAEERGLWRLVGSFYP